MEIRLTTHPFKQRLNNFLFVLEDRASERRLPSVVEGIWVRAMVYEETDERDVTVVGC